MIAQGACAPLKLPPIDFASRAPLAEALRRRCTTRSISPEPLPLQTLSNLLWAAWGVNREGGPFDLPGRTAASAGNSQEMDLYVLMAEGAYCYDATVHILRFLADGDFRALAMTPGQWDADPVAPVHLVFAADFDRIVNPQGFREPGLEDPDVQKAYAHVACGMIGANVYLFAAAEGLAAWFHNCDRESLKSRLGLGETHRVLFAMSVGYPRS